MITRRALAGSGLAFCLHNRRAVAAEAALSAAVLAMSHSQPRSLDMLQITDESGPVSLASFRGRLIILNLWASWCLPCRREMPSLSRLARLLENKPCVVLPLAFDRGGLASARTFYDEVGIQNLPVLAGQSANLASIDEDVGLPSTFVLDAEGLLRWSVTGEAQWDDAETVTWITSILPA